MTFNYIIKYPFSNKAKEYLEKKNIDLLSIDDEALKKATLFILKRIFQKSTENEMQWKEYLKIDDERVAKTFATLYPLCRLLLTVVDYNPLYQRFGDYYEKQFLFYLRQLTDEDEFESLKKDICNQLEYDGKTERYFIYLIDFLSLELSDQFKLQYSKLEKGNVYFSKAEVFELLSAILKKRILKNIDLEKKELPEKFIEYGSYIKKKIIEENLIEQKVINKPEVDSFPPCFLKMYTKLIGGEKLTHIENYYIAVFLSNIGYNFEEILNLFKNSPNYDENIASYQIKKILEKKYAVPSCDTLKSNGLCVKDCNLKHPFQYFKDFKKEVFKK